MIVCLNIKTPFKMKKGMEDGFTALCPEHKGELGKDPSYSRKANKKDMIKVHDINNY